MPCKAHQYSMIYFELNNKVTVAKRCILIFLRVGIFFFLSQILCKLFLISCLQCCAKYMRFLVLLTGVLSIT